jgi:hypothetical protein
MSPAAQPLVSPVVAKAAKASRNIAVSVADGKLTLVVDLSVDLGPSSSGKTNLIATGTEKVAGFEGVSFGLNVFKKAKKS